MPVLMTMSFESATLREYDRVMELLEWETTPKPAGLIMHAAAEDNGRLRVTDVWDTPEQFQRFVEERLRAQIAAAGIAEESNVQMLPIHYIDMT